MFCPKCGQQQVSESTRFCSRCGIAIGGLGEWLAPGEGTALRQGKIKAPPLASARKETKRGAKLMFFSAVLAPVFFGLCFLVDGPAPLLVPLSIFLLGLAMICYAHLFGEEILPSIGRPKQALTQGTMQSETALPPASSIASEDAAGQRVRTKELVQPPSVTERTTRLLDVE